MAAKVDWPSTFQESTVEFNQCISNYQIPVIKIPLDEVDRAPLQISFFHTREEVNFEKAYESLSKRASLLIYDPDFPDLTELSSLIKTLAIAKHILVREEALAEPKDKPLLSTMNKEMDELLKNTIEKKMLYQETNVFAQYLENELIPEAFENALRCPDLEKRHKLQEILNKLDQIEEYLKNFEKFVETIDPPLPQSEITWEKELITSYREKILNLI
jgi:hypothetical protein